MKYRGVLKPTIKVDKPTSLPIPPDYFKDIDSKKLSITLIKNNNHCATLDHKKKTLTMTPKEIGEFELTLVATDEYANETRDVIRIIVEE